MADYCEATYDGERCGSPISVRQGKKRRFCDRHEFQLRKHGRVVSLIRNESQVRGEGALSRRAYVLEAVIALADADAERDGDPGFHAAWVRLRKVTAAWHDVPGLQAELERLRSQLAQVTRQRRAPRLVQRADMRARA